MAKDGEELTRIANNELEKFRLNFSRCTNRDVAPLNRDLAMTMRGFDNGARTRFRTPSSCEHDVKTHKMPSRPLVHLLS